MKSIMQFIGQQITQHRKAKGVDRSALAKWAKIKYEKLGRMERGEQLPTLPELARLVMSLDVTMLDMFYDREDLLPISEHWIRNQGLIRDIVGKLLAFERYVDEQWLLYCKKHLLPYFCELLEVDVPDIEFTRDSAPLPPWHIRDL